jgi:hypothetical protein
VSAVTALTIALLIAATAACAALIWATRELVLTARSLRALTDDTRERLVPLLEKADVTVDATNAELLRIDGAITRFEEASVRVSAATGTLSEIVQAPEKIVSGVADRMRRAWKDRRRPQPGDTGAPDQDIAEEQAESSDEVVNDLVWSELPVDAALDDEPINVADRPED